MPIRLSKREKRQKQIDLQNKEREKEYLLKSNTQWKSIATFSKPNAIAKTAKKKAALPQGLQDRLTEFRSIPSLVTTINSTGKALPKRYSGDMAHREAIARKKKHVVAPAYNKGGLQLITDPEHFKTMGRKI